MAGMDAPARQGIPLRPDYSARPRPSDSIIRAVVAHAHAFVRCEAPPEAYAKRLYPEDRAVETICRGATSPATATGSGWANTVAQTATLDLVSTLGPASAASDLRAGPDFNAKFPVLASNGIAAGTVMAVAVNALAVGADPVPRFEQSKDATLHMEDTSPAQIVSGTSPPPTLAQIAVPVRSLWQSDSVGVPIVVLASPPSANAGQHVRRHTAPASVMALPSRSCHSTAR